MGYYKIKNLYRDDNIQLFKKVYALEKIHGTSANISYYDDALHFYQGGVTYELFTSLFDKEKLLEDFRKLGVPELTIYGEAYGGSVHQMKATYGDKLKFVVFDSAYGKYGIGDGHRSFYDVGFTKGLADGLGLEFVYHEIISTDLDSINAARARCSEQAKRNGCGDDKISEGVVLRPIKEMRLWNGDRIIAKHKNELFSERLSKRDTVLDPDLAKIKYEAQAAADEFVTEMRLTHILSSAAYELKLENIPKVLDDMQKDIEAECDGEYVKSSQLWKCVRTNTAKMFKKRLENGLE